jgi:hypothetical protein
VLAKIYQNIVKLDIHMTADNNLFLYPQASVQPLNGICQV